MSIFQNGIWSCGFDFLPDGVIAPGGVFDSAANGSTGAVGAIYAAYSGKGFQLQQGSAIGRSLNGNLPSLYTGFHFKAPALPASGVNSIATFYDSVAGGSQFCLGYNPQGQIGFYASGGQISSTSLGQPSSPIVISSAGTLIPATYPFLEIFAHVASSGGALTLRLNGVVVATFIGNTQRTANAWVNQIFWGNNQSSGITNQYDDIYILDTTGPAPFNTFLGPGRLQTDGPTQDSATAGLNTWAFTTPQGSDFANAADIPASVSNYNSSATVGQRMSFRFPNLSTAAQVLFLNTWISAQEDAAGTRIITPIYRSNSVDQSGGAIGLAGGYTYYTQNSITDPNTGQLWANELPSVVAGCEIGVQLTG
jgi:hypothetical protein